MKAKFFRYIFIRSVAVSLAAFATATAVSCTDDLVSCQDTDSPSGEEATVSLSFAVGDVSKLTRAEIDENDAKRVNTLWIGIYNASTGDCTANLFLNKTGDHGFAPGTNNHALSQLTDISTKSGKSYIVAVANPDQYMGITAEDADKFSTLENADNSKIYKSLTTLLEAATNWKDYKSIMVTGTTGQNNSIDIQAPSINENKGLLMSGIYTEMLHVDPTNSHPDISETPYYISAGDNKLTGAIHLRRLISNIKFNIEAKGSVVEVTPQSYQVHNVPFASWVHERVDNNPGEKNRIGYANAGDALQPDYKINGFYRSSLIFTSTSFDKTVTATDDGGSTTSYSFDFWMTENKRTGIQTFGDNMTDNEKYATREREYDDKGSIIDPTQQTGTMTPSGIFISLSASFDSPSLNNKAAYVDIPCVVKYKSDTAEEEGPGSAIPPGMTDDEGLLNPGAVRTANITYRIHLGYINKDAKDFNSYRNSDYTYNVKISDLHSVIVEAFRKGDPQPGGFGDVTDVSDKFFELDAHYGVFNIYLTQDEINSFSFRLLSYDNNVQNVITGGPENDIENTHIDENNWKYYNWIAFVYNEYDTPDKDDDKQKRTIAKYPGTPTFEEYNDGSAKLLFMRDFVDPIKKNSLKEGWYTVFVSEYAYEDFVKKGDETGIGWHSYVNQPDRMFWINVAQKVASDGASAFYQAKYAGVQHAIQTYYIASGDTKTAIGVEHDNENFGMNIRWTSAVKNMNKNNVNYGGDLSPDNGRYNVWHSLMREVTDNRDWNYVLTTEQLQYVNGINNDKVQNYITEEQKKGGFRNVIQMAMVPQSELDYKFVDKTGDDVSFSNVSTSFANSYDPQTNSATAQYVQAMYSCMNRNRDENGNGKIDQSELKWYLPASGKYLRVILGRNSLVTPIMKYDNRNLPYSPSGRAYDKDGLYHMISSDDKVLWADQGMATSLFASNDPYTCAPWQVRCVRNLGTNLSEGLTMNNGDGVTPAYKEYKHGNTGAVIRVPYYYGSALRNPTTSSLPVHRTNSEWNRLGRYGFEIAYCGNSATESYDSYETPIYNSGSSLEDYMQNGTSCDALNKDGKTGWRLPNQKELAIMLRCKFDGKYTLNVNGNEYFVSCTIVYWNNQGLYEAEIKNVADYRVIACTYNNNYDESSGRQMAAQKFGEVSWRLRCVRDLQAGEYPEYP